MIANGRQFIVYTDRNFIKMFTKSVRKSREVYPSLNLMKNIITYRYSMDASRFNSHILFVVLSILMETRKRLFQTTILTSSY